MKRLRGSITVFLAFVMTMVLGLFFTMSEVLRFFCLKKQTDRASQMAVESCFADYCRPLFEEYGILGVDLSYGKENLDKETFEKRLYRYLDENGNSEGTHFFQAYPEKSVLSGYSVLTDSNYAGLIKEAAASVKDNVGEEMLSFVAELKDKVKKAEDKNGGIDELVGSGGSVMNGGTPPAAVTTVKGTKPDEKTMKKIEAAENPLLGIVPITIGGILKIVLPKGSKVSAGRLLEGRKERASGRTLESGTNGGAKENPSVYEEGLYRFWLAKTFRDYTETPRDDSVSYEMEYLICGKDRDEENLKGTVWRLLLLREGLNLAAISKDSARVGQAEVLALIIATLLTQPELEKAVEGVILAIWAYVESILDVRRLITGGKVPFIKTPADWTSELWSLIGDVASWKKAREGQGFMVDYSGYLMAFVSMIPADTTAARACDLIEDHIRRDEKYRNIRMDRMLFSADLDIQYQAKPLFLSFVPLFTGEMKIYDFPYRRRFSYLEGESEVQKSLPP